MGAPCSVRAREHLHRVAPHHLVEGYVGGPLLEEAPITLEHRHMFQKGVEPGEVLQGWVQVHKALQGAVRGRLGAPLHQDVPHPHRRPRQLHQLGVCGDTQGEGFPGLPVQSEWGRRTVVSTTG